MCFQASVSHLSFLLLFTFPPQNPFEFCCSVEKLPHHLLWRPFHSLLIFHFQRMDSLKRCSILCLTFLLRRQNFHLSRGVCYQLYLPCYMRPEVHAVVVVYKIPVSRPARHSSARPLCSHPAPCRHGGASPSPPSLTRHLSRGRYNLLARFFGVLRSSGRILGSSPMSEILKALRDPFFQGSICAMLWLLGFRRR